MSQKEELEATKRNVEALGQTVDSVVEAVQTLDNTLAAQEEKLSQILTIIMRNQHSVDAHEIAETKDPNREGMVEFDEADGGGVEVIRSPYQDVDDPAMRKWQEDEAFLHEKVEILFHPTSDKNADPIIPPVPHGGRYWPGRNHGFLRDRTYVVPRAVVATLAAARPVHYGNEEYTKANGERAVRNPTWRGLRYPFSVMNDSEKGKRWLANLLQQP